MEEEAKVPAWLVTFSDLMTLLLTFFVLLLSMSIIDEEKKLIALGSIRNTFGFVEGHNVQEREESANIQQEGLYKKEDIKDLQFEEATQAVRSNEELTFMRNRDVYSVHIDPKILFQRGSSVLLEDAKRYLRSVLPVIMATKHPIKILGNATTLFDEFGEKSGKTTIDLWRLSLYRAMAVYTMLHEEGIPYEKMLFEGIADNNPLLRDKNSAQALARSRSVNIVLHKEDENLLKNAVQKEGKNGSTILFHGFEFSVP